MINLLGHLANLLYIVGYLVKDILGLRLLIASGLVIEIIYSYYISEIPLWTNIIWCFLYIAVNGWQIVFLLLERRTIMLNEEEKRLYDKIFRNFSVREFWKVEKTGFYVDYEAGEILTSENELLDRLILIVRGSCDIVLQNRSIAQISDLSFIGEMGFLSDKPASASVVTSSPTRCLIWDKAKLKTLMNNDSRINVCMQSIFTTDLIIKLRNQNFEVLAKLQKYQTVE